MSDLQEKPLVSVLIPCYNHGEYVAEAIESILNQTYKNLELLIVDNGSTDDSYEVINRYSDRVRVFHLDKNDPLLAMRMMQKEAKGQYFALMTADDFWLPEKLEKQMKAFAENCNVRACFTWIHTIDERGDIIQNSTHNVFNNVNRSRHEWLEKIITKDNCFAYPSVVLERRCYQDVYEKRFCHANDVYMWMRILLQYDVHVVEEPLTMVRWHPNSKHPNMSSLGEDYITKKMSDEPIMVEDIIERMSDDFFVKAFKKYMRNQSVVSHEQIECEKFFFLMKLAEKKRYLEPVVGRYYLKHNKMQLGSSSLWEDTMERYYQYTYADFKEYYIKHSTGCWLLQLSDANRLQKHLQEQQIFFDIWREVATAELSVSERKQLYKSKVYAQLDNNTKELVRVIREYGNGIFDFIGNSTEQELQTGMPEILESISQLSVMLDKLWDMFLYADGDIGEEEWKYNMQILKQEKDVELFCEIVLPFLIKIVGILNAYLGLDG